MIIVAFIVLLVGIVAGLLIGNIPYITMSSDVRLGELGTFLTSLTVAFVIPILINGWIDKKKYIRTLSSSDLTLFGEKSAKIKSIIEASFQDGTFSENQRRNVFAIICDLDHMCVSIEDRFVKMKLKKSIGVEELKKSYLEFWKEATDGGFASQSFRVDEAYLRKFHTSYYCLDRKIKDLIIAIINKL